MLEFQKRVVDEHSELAGRLKKLDALLMGGGVFATLPTDEKTRLAKQADAMRSYLDILRERIAAFT